MARSVRLRRRSALVGLPDNQLRPSRPRGTSPARHPPGPVTSLDRYSRQSHGTKKHRDRRRWADPFLCSNAESASRKRLAAPFISVSPAVLALRASLKLHAAPPHLTSSLFDHASHHPRPKNSPRP